MGVALNCSDREPLYWELHLVWRCYHVQTCQAYRVKLR